MVFDLFLKGKNIRERNAEALGKRRQHLLWGNIAASGTWGSLGEMGQPRGNRAASVK